jgi:hypothetical protein
MAFCLLLSGVGRLGTILDEMLDHGTHGRELLAQLHDLPLEFEEAVILLTGRIRLPGLRGFLLHDKGDAEFIAVAPHQARFFPAVTLGNDEVKELRNIDCTRDLQPSSRFGDVADHAFCADRAVCVGNFALQERTDARSLSVLLARFIRAVIMRKVAHSQDNIPRALMEYRQKLLCFQ